MQARAADDLRKLVTDRLVAEGLTYEGAQGVCYPASAGAGGAWHSGAPARHQGRKKRPACRRARKRRRRFPESRRLEIDQRSQGAARQERRFLRRGDRQAGPAGDRCHRGCVARDGRNFPLAEVDALGRSFRDAGRLIMGASATFHRRNIWAGDRRARSLCRSNIDGIKGGDETRGHRFMAPAPIKVRRFDDYVAKLEKAKVVLDPARRADMIHADAKNLAFAQGFELVEDEGLLAEVAGLVEWPVTLMGTFDQAFLSIPGEVIRATIRNNQKCFVLRDPQTAKLVNKFILVANEEASDGGKAIVAGNERVIRARLSDAKFFYEHRPEDSTGRPAAEIRADCFPREVRHAGRAHCAHCGTRRADCAHRRRQDGTGRAGCATVQDRPFDRSGRRIP